LKDGLQKTVYFGVCDKADLNEGQQKHSTSQSPSIESTAAIKDKIVS
jgi:hypothetical protein